MTAVIVFTAKARNTGTKLKNVDRLVFYKYAEKGDIPFKNVAELREKIVEYSKLVFICACGIAVRTIAPFVKNKKDDFALFPSSAFCSAFLSTTISDTSRNVVITALSPDGTRITFVVASA